jgi:hypothetical protein
MLLMRYWRKRTAKLKYVFYDLSMLPPEATELIVEARLESEMMSFLCKAYCSRNAVTTMSSQDPELETLRLKLGGIIIKLIKTL